MRSLKRRPGGIDDERRKPQEHQQRLHPPNIPAGRLPETARLRHGVCVSHDDFQNYSAGRNYLLIQRVRIKKEHTAFANNQ
jgi:hypothetical protein